MKRSAVLLALFLGLSALAASAQIVGRQPQRPATADEQKGKPREAREPRERRKHKHRHEARDQRDWDRDRDRDRDRHRDRDRSSR